MRRAMATVSGRGAPAGAGAICLSVIRCGSCSRSDSGTDGGSDRAAHRCACSSASESSGSSVCATAGDEGKGRDGSDNCK